MVVDPSRPYRAGFAPVLGAAVAAAAAARNAAPGVGGGVSVPRPSGVGGVGVPRPGGVDCRGRWLCVRASCSQACTMLLQILDV